MRAAQRTNERIGTQVSVVYATAELDDTQTWQDTDLDGNFDVYFWIKNVGTTRILDVTAIDIFLGTDGNFQRIPYVDYAAGGFPRWSYSVENGTDWTDTVTIKVSVDYSSTLATDEYFVKVVTPAGAADDHYFSF